LSFIFATVKGNDKSGMDALRKLHGMDDWGKTFYSELFSVGGRGYNRTFVSGYLKDRRREQAIYQQELLR